MVQSKLTLLALAGSALAGVVRREELEFDHLDSEDLPVPPPNWVTPTSYPSDETVPSHTAFVQALSDHSQEQHSTYIPSGLLSHFPQPSEEALPPFITSYPGAGEFAHTKDSAKPTSLSPSIPPPAPPGASYDEPPPAFSDPVRPEEPQLNTLPTAFQASSDHPRIPSAHAETAYASPTKPPSFTDRPIPSSAAFVKPTESWYSLGSVEPTGSSEIPSWISNLPPPSKITPRPVGSEVDHDTAPSVLPEAYQGPPPLPSDSISVESYEPHSSSPAGPHDTPPPDDYEQGPHPPTYDSASGKPPGIESTSPSTEQQPPPPHGSYQQLPPFDVGSGGNSGESGPPAEPHQITPPSESYQGSPPTFTVPEPSQPKSSSPSGSHELPPPPTDPHYESSSPSFDSAPVEPYNPQSSSPAAYHIPPPSSPQSSYPDAADHPTEPVIPHGGPSPYYGAAPRISCTFSKPGEVSVDISTSHPMGQSQEHPHLGHTNAPPFNHPFEYGKESDELASPHAVQTSENSEKSSVPHTDTFVPYSSKPKPTVTEAPSGSHAPVPSSARFNCTEMHSQPAVPSPTNGKSRLQGATGENHTYGSSPTAHYTESSGVAKRPSATKAVSGPSKTGVPEVVKSAVPYSSLASASAFPITILLGAFATSIFFLQ